MVVGEKEGEEEDACDSSGRLLLRRLARISSGLINGIYLFTRRVLLVIFLLLGREDEGV